MGWKPVTFKVIILVLFEIYFYILTMKAYPYTFYVSQNLANFH